MDAAMDGVRSGSMEPGEPLEYDASVLRDERDKPSPPLLPSPFSLLIR